MEIIRTKKELREAIRGLRAIGKTVGLVPTMGALHAGHLSLVDIAKNHADTTVATLFVNPKQFGPNEDFSRYPRTEAEDLRQFEAAGVDTVYVPDAAEIYPEGFVTQVAVQGINKELEGVARPVFFDGIATVVTKLFMQASPDIAVFGEKDFQQLHIIKQMVRDLDIPVCIIGAATLREADGLAMASRNRYLNEKERAVAPALYRALSTIAQELRAGTPSNGLLKEAKASLLTAGFTKVDYIELRDAQTLIPVTDAHTPARLLAAAYLGTTRLIDNIEVKP